MVPNDTMLLKMKVSLCCIYACNAYTNVTDVVIGRGGREGNYTVEGCMFLENEATGHGSAVALRTFLYYGRLEITVFRNK